MEILQSTCPFCNKTFAKQFSLNRHIKRIHPKQLIESRPRRNLIACPLCDERNEIKTHELLQDHLQQIHQISIEHSISEFSSKLEYEAWKRQENLETRYIRTSTSSRQLSKIIYFSCNKSNISGYESKCCKRKEKFGGTIKMQGACPARLIVTIHDNGEKVTVNYWKTHVGHDENELRSKRLSTIEKNLIVKKLKSGVPVDRIIEDARQLKTAKLDRINLLNKKEVAYLSKKFNVGKTKQNEMGAAVSKVALGEACQIKVEHEKEIAVFVEEQPLTQQGSQPSKEEAINILRNFVSTVENLNEEDIAIVLKEIGPIIDNVNQLSERRNQTTTATKRKMEKQDNFPQKRK